MGGSQYLIKEQQQKEQNYLTEIKTLERHLDHLTHQLELNHKAMRELQEDRDNLEKEVHNHQALNHGNEQGRDQLQRALSQLEHDKEFL